MMATALERYITQRNPELEPDFLPPHLLVPLIDGSLLLELWQRLAPVEDERPRRRAFAQSLFELLRAYMLQHGTVCPTPAGSCATALFVVAPSCRGGGGSVSADGWVVG